MHFILGETMHLAHKDPALNGTKNAGRTINKMLL